MKHLIYIYPSVSKGNVINLVKVLLLFRHLCLQHSLINYSRKLIILEDEDKHNNENQEGGREGIRKGIVGQRGGRRSSEMGRGRRRT
jgi:hypothetical protein